MLRAQRERDVAAAALAAAQQEILGLQAQRERDAKAAELAVSRQVIPKLQARLGIRSEESQRRRLPDADVVATALTATQQETFELHAKRGGPSSSPAAEANATTKAIETAEQSVGPAQTAVSIEDPALQADKDDSHQLQHTCRVHCTSSRSGHGATSPALGAAVAARCSRSRSVSQGGEAADERSVPHINSLADINLKGPGTWRLAASLFRCRHCTLLRCFAKVLG